MILHPNITSFQAAEPPNHLPLCDFQGNFHHQFLCVGLHLLSIGTTKIFLHKLVETWKAALDTSSPTAQTNPVNHVTLNSRIVMWPRYFTQLGVIPVLNHFHCRQFLICISQTSSFFFFRKTHNYCGTFS